MRINFFYIIHLQRSQGKESAVSLVAIGNKEAVETIGRIIGEEPTGPIFRGWNLLLNYSGDIYPVVTVGAPLDYRVLESLARNIRPGLYPDAID